MLDGEWYSTPDGSSRLHPHVGFMGGVPAAVHTTTVFDVSGISIVYLEVLEKPET